MRPGVGSSRGADLRYDLDLTLEEAAHGGDREIHVTRSEKCAPCGGSGAKAGTKPLSCPECKGTGQKQDVKTKKDMRLVTLTTCVRCGGRGHIIESPCAHCQGNGFQFVPHRLKVRIPPGVDEGMMIRLSGQGDLFVVVEVRTPTDLTERERELIQELADLQEVRVRDQGSDARSRE